MWYKCILAQKNLDIQLPDYIYHILGDIQQVKSESGKHGRALIVGGAVRDAMLGLKSKDIDFEVYNVTYEQLDHILQAYGQPNLVGQSFGVIKFRGPDGQEYDFSLPRIDNKAGVKHTDFNVQVSSDLSPAQAAMRRDFTINAISYDPITKEIIDPLNGIQDLQKGILRHTGIAFADDPLRVLRMIQFAGRFGFDVDPNTIKIAQTIADQFQHLPVERIREEFKKLLLKGKDFKKALRVLNESGWSKHFPALHDLFGVPQEPEWHPEGDVAEHTAYVMNEAARIADELKLSADEKEILMYAALLHDVGKPSTTKTLMKNGVERITSHGHEEAGAPIARQFLESLGESEHKIKKIENLVKYHLAHVHFVTSGSTDSFIKKLADNLFPAKMKELGYLIEADHSGRPPLEKKMPTDAYTLLQRAEALNLHDLNAKPEPPLRGEDVIKYIPPGPEVGSVLAEAKRLWLAHNPAMHSRASALRWLHEKLTKPIITGTEIMQYTNVRGPEISALKQQALKAQEEGVFNDLQSGIEWLKKQNV